jgi:hypothetical protein
MCGYDFRKAQPALLAECKRDHAVAYDQFSESISTKAMRQIFPLRFAQA